MQLDVRYSSHASFLIFIALIAVAIVALVGSYLAKKKRREGFALVATQLGMELLAAERSVRVAGRAVRALPARATAAGSRT